MNAQEELVYLSDLLMQAALWRTNDSGNSPLELEVMERVKRLRNSLGAAPNEIYGDTAPANPTAPAKVRVKHEDGKYRWHNIDECEKVSLGGNRFKWRLKYINSGGQAVVEKVPDDDSLDEFDQEQHRAAAEIRGCL